jgi:trehalose 6-phosphate phosphatase
MTQPAPKGGRAPAGQARRIDALLVDLDGVVTRTAVVHARAWKRLFDAFLARQEGDQPPFDEVGEYRAHVDGKPRYDGVRDFLAARGITLPEGDPGDAPGWDTVCALGNMKDGYFHEALQADGVELFEATVARLREAKANGVRLAAVSASRNAAAVLAKGGLADLFDCRVDGVVLARLGLPGKPAPDMFLHAAEELGVAPARAGVIEDAVAGVQAGHAGGFALVIGIGDNTRAPALSAAGADIVVPDLGGLDLDAAAPSALAHFDAVVARIAGHPALFLDYDGTLTPIVARPELAVLDEATRAALARLAALCPVAVISGRARADVENLVGLDSLVYAGSHGFDIRAPGGAAIGQAVDRRYLDALAAAADGLRAKLHAIDGVIVEDKTYAVAVHYRLVAEPEVDAVERAVAEAAAAHPELRRTGGKKIFELRPALDWDKGKAVLALIEALGLGGDVVPIYIGDDETDYDAFEALKGRGIGVLVSDGPPPRPVDYCLRDADEVRKFLDRLADLLSGDAR